MLIIGMFLLGIVIGPMLGIAVDRTVERVKPAAAHRCSTCETDLGFRSLVPVLAWTQQCPSCGDHKGLRYPGIDVATAVVFALTAARFGDDWMLVPYLGIAAVAIVLSAIDFETHLLPNIVMWPAIGVSIFVVFVLSGELNYGDGIQTALLGAAVFGGFIGLAHVVYEQGMGRGDVKLSLLLGLYLGWLQTDTLLAIRLVLYAILISLFGGAVLGTIYNVVRRRGRAEIPFGPALAAGSLVVILLSTRIVGAGGP